MDTKQKMLELSERAQEAARLDEHELAIELVEEILEFPGADKRWGLGFIQVELSRLRKAERDPQLAEAFAAQERAIGDRLLAMKSCGEAWLHRWERARQLNQRAWDGYEKHAGRKSKGSKKALQEALADAQASLDFWPYFLSHLDTQVRILLALGRTDQAYHLVRWVDAIQLDWPDFFDLISSRTYKRFKAAHANKPIELPAGQATVASSDKRPGQDEWHRARNAALVAMVDDGLIGPADLADLRPQKVDMSKGTLHCSDGDRAIPPETLEKLRHWMLYGFSNHPAAQAGTAKTRPGRYLFMDHSLEPLSTETITTLSKRAGKAA